MLPFTRKHSEKAGLPPGALIHVGERKTGPVTVKIMTYDETRFEEREAGKADLPLPLPEQAGITWIHVIGLHDLGIIEKIGACYPVHPLILEDILNTAQRPKAEVYEDCLFVVLKRFHNPKDGEDISVEQVSLVVGEDFVISFQESGTDIFSPVRKRIVNRMGRIRKRGCDYLAYALIDTVIDYHFSVMEALEENIEAIEENLADPSMTVLQDICALKRNVLLLRKSVLPLRDLTYRLEKDDSEFIKDTTRIYLRDLYDHAVQIADTVETFREMASGLLDLYHSGVSNRMNEVMKVLTVISTTFIPLSFIAGVYGMNFKYMPELEFKWGYALVWGVILGVGGTMLIFFKRKKWL
ncbi:magnesium and cobalt transport protein CorA [Desulfonema ishimotonii]|uniref:Magnesium transport protein CorA n=1 Tax=Desulfonema ishimotonii TaxID=45657 RepID=A0A401G007_9BACT|nr:magnesium/cobalt transporter CorA [Desulfonema ishimotonii]GBC62551.1 magnesium and cobalt transport protein CorA [Desulfonema ishimotonii]